MTNVGYPILGHAFRGLPEGELFIALEEYGLQTRPARTDKRCEAHKDHRPEPLYQELHHVVPQAWQQFYVPDHTSATAAIGAPTRDGEPVTGVKLWDGRTVALCRTGHGNVHWILTRFMHEWYEIDRLLGVGHKPSLNKVVFNVRRQNAELQRGRHAPEQETALLGMERFLTAGGDLRELCDHDLFGEI